MLSKSLIQFPVDGRGCVPSLLFDLRPNYGGGNEDNGIRKSWLKTQHSENQDHGIWSHHLLANRWGNNGNSDRLFWGAQITADDDCSHEIKRRLILGRNVMTNLDSILKSRNFTLPTKVHLVKAMYGFSSSHGWM